jgi:signal transduction histidine kinase
VSTTAAILRAPFADRARRELAYAVVSLLPAIPAFALALVGLVTAALSLAGVGLPFLALTLASARRSGSMFRPFARAILDRDWPTPTPLRARGAIGCGRALLGDGAAWRALLYCLVKLPLTAATAYGGVVALLAGLLAVTAPAWWFLPWDGSGLLHSDFWAGTWWLAAQGVLVLLAGPWFVRLLVGVDGALVRALLMPPRDRERIKALEAGRDLLTADAAATLRRIERDLHDGTQARLVSLGMTLSRLERRVEQPDVRDMIATARKVVSDGLDELREIIRGMHPPALDDGLSTALATLASRSPVPTELCDHLSTRPTGAVANALYFSAAELLTNVARHAHASKAVLSIRETSAAIVMTVHDDGRGGADAASGTGLTGLRRRAEAFDGTLEVRSPAGGHTSVVMTIPKG